MIAPHKLRKMVKIIEVTRFIIYFEFVAIGKTLKQTPFINLGWLDNEVLRKTKLKNKNLQQNWWKKVLNFFVGCHRLNHCRFVFFKQKLVCEARKMKWCRLRESNSRPTVYKTEFSNKRQRIKKDDNNKIKAFDDFICWGWFWLFVRICG